MKRKLLASLLVAMLCITTALAVENPFTDIASDSDLAQPVLWALEEGITNGTSDTTFGPDDTCTRGQVVTFLWRANGEPTPTTTENPFTDVTPDDYYYEAVLWAVEEGITNGTGDTTFSPNDTCTSGQVLTFLYRANGQPDAAEDTPYFYTNAVNWAIANGLVTEVSPDENSPRSEIVTCLYRDAGSPEVTITEAEVDAEVEEAEVEEEVQAEDEVQAEEEVAPETAAYSYTMPTVEKPGDATLSVDYMSQVMLYMLVNDLTSYSITFYNVIGYDLEDQGLFDIVSDAFAYTKCKYIDLCGFYIGQSCGWSSLGTTTTVTITLNGDSLTAEETITYKAAFIEEIETMVNEWFDTGVLDESDSDYTKALYFYRWCALNLKYDTTFQRSSYQGYGTLTTGTGICQGYTSVFNAMCNVAGIEVSGVGGQAGGDGHVWSYANLDGSWLYVDATYGDPLPNIAGRCDESYFAVTKAFISTTHTFDALFD